MSFWLFRRRKKKLDPAEQHYQNALRHWTLTREQGGAYSPMPQREAYDETGYHPDYNKMLRDAGLGGKAS